MFGRWSALPLIAFPLLYNDVFLVGTMNYVFGIGLMLWALAAWVALRERGRALRLLVSTLFVLGLVLLPPVRARGLWRRPAGLRIPPAVDRSMCGCAAHRVAMPPAAALPPLILDFVLTGVPFLLVPALVVMSPTRGLWDYYWQMDGKMDGLLFVIQAYSQVVAFVFAADRAVGAAGWALRRRALSFHGFGLALLAVGAVVYMALPRVMFETYMVDLRLPISLAFILMACIDLDFRNRVVQLSFAVGLRPARRRTGGGGRGHLVAALGRH